MKKGTKIFLAIIIIAVVVVAGVFVYNKFFANKIKEIEETRGWNVYAAAANSTSIKEKFTISYTIEDDREADEISKKGKITVDDFGHYHAWEGSASGSEYIVNTRGANYAIFEVDDKDNKTSKTTNTYNYGSVYEEEYLEFINKLSKSDSESHIKETYYSSVTNVEKEEFTHLFGKVKNTFVWVTKYKCVYTENGVKYSSSFERKVYYETMITEVNVEINDKEIDDSGEVKKNGEKKSFKMNQKISAKIYQPLVKVDFSEFPAVA